MRTAVLDLLISENKALAIKDFDQQLTDYDRVTLYRTLKTFEDQGIIHSIVDGNRQTSYALCSHHCTEHHHHDEHIHFHCTKCEKTICLDDTAAPVITTPAGFQVNQVQLLVEGVCDTCNR